MNNLTSIKMTCRACNGSGTKNNPPAFFGEGEAPELAINCESCEGKGYIEVDNPASIRAAFLVAKKIREKYFPSDNIDSIYDKISYNISRLFETSIKMSNVAYSEDLDLFIDDGDLLFSNDELPIDNRLERKISRFNLIEEAKGILGIDED